MPRGTCRKEGIHTFGVIPLGLLSLSTLAVRLIFACLLFLFPALSMAGEAIIAWILQPDPKVVSYRVYYGPAGRDSEFQVDARSGRKIRLYNLPIKKQEKE